MIIKKSELIWFVVGCMYKSMSVRYFYLIIAFTIELSKYTTFAGCSSWTKCYKLIVVLSLYNNYNVEYTRQLHLYTLLVTVNSLDRITHPHARQTAGFSK